MYVHRKMVFALIVLVLSGLACQVTNQLIAQAPVTPTRTPRPTFTRIPPPTNTPEPTFTATAAPTQPPATSTKPPTPRPTTPKPPPTATKPVVIQPTVSPYEFHVNSPSCAHSGLTYIKGTVYLNRLDPSQRYVGAIVALGPPDGSVIYERVKTDDYGEYTFVLSQPGQARPGTWGLWLVTPSGERKSDIGGPIVTNNLPADNPNACWAGTVDFWK